MSIKSKSLEYKVSDIDNQKGIVTIAISSFDNRDSCDDIVRKGAFIKTFKERGKRQNHFIDHDLNIRSMVGLPLEMFETNTHAIVKSQLNLKIPLAQNLFEHYKFFAEHDRTLEHSFMYRTVKSQKNDDIKGEDITELQMFEYSTVGLGANENTPLLDLKSFKDISAMIYELELRLKKINYTDERAKHIEKLINLLKIYNSDEPDLTTLKSIFEPQVSTQKKTIFSDVKITKIN